MAYELKKKSPSSQITCVELASSVTEKTIGQHQSSVSLGQALRQLLLQEFTAVKNQALSMNGNNSTMMMNMSPTTPIAGNATTTTPTSKRSTPNNHNMRTTPLSSMKTTTAAATPAKSIISGIINNNNNNVSTPMGPDGKPVTTNSLPAVSFRETTLTKVLQRSLEGSKICIIGSISPLAKDYDQTTATLDYLRRLVVKPGKTATSPFQQ